MKWQGKKQSGNVEDRRAMSSGGKVVAGGGLIGIIILLMNIFGGETGQQLAPILEQFNNTTVQQESGYVLTERDQDLGKMVDVVLTNTEEVWTKIFNENGLEYQKSTLVLFRGEVTSACGKAQSGSGPFYCTGDNKVYMDLDFFEILQTRFGAKEGEFAIAYVIAHEIGHHVQNQLGILQKVNALKRQKTAEGKRMYIAMELQADFYAGLWAHHAKDYLEINEEDIKIALSAASSVGDDNIQKRTQGYVDQESFTHGTSEQRMRWFLKGFRTGDVKAGDTFSQEEL
jgi:uncharacterized protein